MEIRFGLLGCGRISPKHVMAIGDTPDTRLVAVCDIRPDRIEGFDEGIRKYTHYREFLADEDIDVVSVCTPSGLHAEMSIEAMKAGKHVVCEKPMALHVADAREMIRTAHEMDRKLCIVLQNRYNSPVQRAKRAIQEGGLGDLKLGSATVRWYRPQSYYNDEWHGTLAMDGGALMNQSIHHIDALQWLMNIPVRSVYAKTATLIHRMEAEDTGLGIWEFENGALGQVEGSTITYPKNLEGSVAIFGEKGSIKIGGTALNRLEVWRIDGQEDEEEAILAMEQATDPPSVYGFSHSMVYRDMIDAIIADRQPETNGDEGIKSLILVRAMYESSEKGMPIEIQHIR